MVDDGKTLYFWISGHGNSIIDEETNSVSKIELDRNVKLITPSYCGKNLSVDNLDPMVFYSSSFKDRQFVINLENGILPVLSNRKHRSTADFEISQYSSVVYNGGMEYEDINIEFRPNYGNQIQDTNYGGLFKVGVFRLPLIDDNIENCENNKHEFFFRPWACDCNKLPCDFDIDELNNNIVNGRKNIYFTIRNRYENIDIWTKSSSIFNDQTFLENGGEINEDGYITIKLSDIIKLLINIYPNNKLVIICSTCRSYKTSCDYNILYDRLINTNEYTDKYNYLAINLVNILSDFTRYTKYNMRMSRNIRYQYRELIKNLDEIVSDRSINNIEYIIYVINSFEEFLCNNKEYFNSDSLDFLSREITIFSDTIPKNLISDVQKITKKVDLSRYDDTNYDYKYKLKCL